MVIQHFLQVAKAIHFTIMLESALAMMSAILSQELSLRPELRQLNSRMIATLLIAGEGGSTAPGATFFAFGNKQLTAPAFFFHIPYSRRQKVIAHSTIWHRSKI
jgi:hypothetical protein